MTAKKNWSTLRLHEVITECCACAVDWNVMCWHCCWWTVMRNLGECPRFPTSPIFLGITSCFFEGGKLGAVSFVSAKESTDAKMFSYFKCPVISSAMSNKPTSFPDTTVIKGSRFGVASIIWVYCVVLRCIFFWCSHHLFCIILFQRRDFFLFFLTSTISLRTL